MTNITYYDTPQALESAGKSLIIPTDVILDVGCGIRPQTFFEPRVHIGIDPFFQYLYKLQETHPHIIGLMASWQDYEDMALSHAVDTIFALDVIEHMTEDRGAEFIEQAIEHVRKQVIIFTPLGYYHQQYEPSGIDRWGFNGGYWQTHRSGWTPEDFGEGWQVLACKDYHKYDQYDQKLETPIGAMYCIYTKGE